MNNANTPKQWAGPSKTPTIEELADRYAVCQLVKTYALGIDTRDFDLARSAFADDTITEGHSDKQTIDDYLKMLFKAVDSYAVTQHNITNQYVTIKEDKAIVWSYAVAYHSKKREFGNVELVVGVTYKDECKRSDDGWLITQRKVSMHWTQGELP